MLRILSQTEMPHELRLWLVMILLVIFLLVGVVLALVLGRMLGPRGPWARMDRELSAKMRQPSQVPDAWEESAKRMRVADEHEQAWDDEAPDDEDDDEGNDTYDRGF